jgi:hypothetical protein
VLFSAVLALMGNATLGQHTALALLSLVANNDAYTVRHDHALTVAAPGVLGNDLNLLGGTTAVLNATPTHGTLALRSDGSFTYTPSAGYVGADTFRYHAHDFLVNSNVATVTINVTNAAPIANADSYTASTGIQKSVPAPGVLGNDTDADGDPLSAQLVDGGGNGSLDLNADGSFTFKSGGSFVGDRTFTYRVWDGHAWSGVATVTITVSGPGPTPTPAPAPTPTPTPTGPPGPTPTPRPGPTATPSPTSATPGSSARPSAAPGTTPAPTPPVTPTAPASTTGASIAPADPQGPAAGPAGPATGGTGSGTSLGIDPIDPMVSVDGVDFVGFADFEWAVPSLVLSVPGLLLILAIAAQGGAGILSMPFVRRWLGGFGLRRRREAPSGRA